MINNWTQAGSWIIDGTPPNGTITINNNALATNSAQVTLTLSANDALTGVDEMKFSNNNTNWTASELYAVSKNWSLTAGDGRKTVYVKYKEGAGNWSDALTDDITMDATPPQLNITTPEDGSIVRGY